MSFTVLSVDVVTSTIPFGGSPASTVGELCHLNAKGGATTYHRYCTVYVILNSKPVTLAVTYVRSDEKENDARKHIFRDTPD